MPVSRQDGWRGARQDEGGEVFVLMWKVMASMNVIAMTQIRTMAGEQHSYLTAIRTATATVTTSTLSILVLVPTSGPYVPNEE
jgi:hypothetical protein